MKTRVAVIGTGAFGRNHLRVLHELADVELVAAFDEDAERARSAAQPYNCRVAISLSELYGKIDAAVVATPTTTHAPITIDLLQHGIDVLVEKPIAPDVASARRMTEAAQANKRVLQVGHLERFNPAIIALSERITTPLFFEVHRMNVFSPRSLDVDVVLDLMIHDLDILLSFTQAMPVEVRAAGLAILSKKVDIANVRLAFANGCIANLTASRVSTERIRKLRLFQPDQYISLDYQKQEAAIFSVNKLEDAPPESPEREIGFDQLSPEKQEPLKVEVSSFIDCVRTRSQPRVTSQDATRALELSLAVLDKIEEHLQLVASTLSSDR